MIGCSSHSIFSGKKVTSKKISQKQEEYIEDRQVNSIFKSTLSSFVPIEEDYSDTDMSWKKMIKNFFIDSNIILYIISCLMIIWIIFIGIKHRHNFKIPKSKSKSKSRSRRKV
jgi:large-conductance mechanosensitive channel